MEWVILIIAVLIGWQVVSEVIRIAGIRRINKKASCARATLVNSIGSESICEPYSRWLEKSNPEELWARALAHSYSGDRKKLGSLSEKIWGACEGIERVKKLDCLIAEHYAHLIASEIRDVAFPPPLSQEEIDEGILGFKSVVDSLFPNAAEMINNPVVRKDLDPMFEDWKKRGEPWFRHPWAVVKVLAAHSVGKAKEEASRMARENLAEEDRKDKLAAINASINALKNGETPPPVEDPDLNELLYSRKTLIACIDQYLADAKKILENPA